MTPTVPVASNGPRPIRPRKIESDEPEQRVGLTPTTERILARVPGNPQVGLQRADAQWQAVRAGTRAVPQVITRDPRTLTPEVDVAISGGTLGILLGAALQQRGWRVTVIERGALRGRDQEWNISREELATFGELGLLSAAELETAIASEYNPARVSFHKQGELWVEDVLNVGVDPVYLLETLRDKFLAAGGTLREHCPFESAAIAPDGVAIRAGETEIAARLLVDAMGNFSPIAAQARQGAKPDGACVVVGSCARGYPSNDTGDLLASVTPIDGPCQYFWEAFPARDGRTTYLFSYLDADERRPDLGFFLDEYFRLLPDYQGVDLEQLDFERVLFGFFPSFRASPLRVPWARVLPVGDASGMQSPVSFGGFGSMVRHLRRLTDGIDEALQADALDRRSLALLQPYQPNIAVTWLFQRAMSVGVEEQVPPERINRLLGGVFATMEDLGDRVLRPFLQDVVQFPALTQTLLRTALARPQVVLPVIPRVGARALLGWTGHYLMLALYALLDWLGRSLALRARADRLPPKARYIARRWLDAWKYGSGGDYGK